MGRLFKNWRRWFKKQPWSLKWFLLLILLNPVISMFWDLKAEEGGGFLSPLQLAGMATFLLATLHIVNERLKLVGYEMFILFFGILLLFNNVIILSINVSISGLGFLFRNLLPLLLYFYLRRVIKNRVTFEGILVTFLIGSTIPVSLFLYEFFFAPIKQVYTSEGRGGFIRLTGFYADLFSYMSYIIGDFIIISYFLLKRRFHFSLIQYLIFFGIAFIGLIGLSHQASWGVFVSILLLLMFFSRESKVSRKIIPIFIIGGIIGGGYFVNTIIKPLYGKEVRVFTGEAGQETALNGRFNRWKGYFNDWGEMSVLNHAFGVGFSGHSSAKNMMGGGMHSDYVRLGFSTGIVGLILYLFFYFSLFIRGKILRKPERFLLLSAISIMLLYAITANPFGSSGALIYITLSVFAFIALKPSQIYR